MLASFVTLAKMNKLGCCARVGGWCEVEFMFLMVTHTYELRVTMGNSGLCYVSVTAF